MVVVKGILAGLIAVAVLLVVTLVYVWAAAGVWPRRGGSVGIDIALLPRLTVYSPVYWLVVVVVGAILWWLLRRWLFA